MGMPKQKFLVRSKTWIEDNDGNVVFGEGRYRILELIDHHRSLQKAAKELKMSYRALWGRIKASEERLGRDLVAREGRGSRLTPFGHKLMTRYRQLQDRLCREADAMYEDLMSDQLDGQE